jgi:hypothetical protein
LPVVVIEVAPPDAHPRFPAELSAACSDAVRRGRCVIAGQTPAEEHPAAVAIVTWDGRQLAVRVQVGVRRAPGTRWLMRDMLFKEADQPVERWRAVGLTIATLVGELPGHGQTAPAAQPPPKPAPPKPVRRKPPPRPLPAPVRAPRWWIEAGALLGPGLGAAGAPRGGGFAGGAYLLGELPLLAHVSLGYAARPADVRGLSVQFLTLQAGLGVRLELDAADLELDGRVGASLERVGASATRSGAEDSGSRLLPALHLGADVGWPARGFVAVVAGADAWALESPTRITIEGQPVGKVPGAGVLGRLGLRLRLP